MSPTIEAGTVTVSVRISPSEERESVAKFVEYTLLQSWANKDIVASIRSGEYLLVLIREAAQLRPS